MRPSPRPPIPAQDAVSGAGDPAHPVSGAATADTDAAAAATDATVTPDPDCCICCCAVDNEQLASRVPDCSHRFHTRCLLQWWAVSASCPLCRAKLEPYEDTIRRAAREVRFERAVLWGLRKEIEPLLLAARDRANCVDSIVHHAVDDALRQARVRERVEHAKRRMELEIELETRSRRSRTVCAASEEAALQLEAQLQLELCQQRSQARHYNERLRTRIREVGQGTILPAAQNTPALAQPSGTFEHTPPPTASEPTPWWQALANRVAYKRRVRQPRKSQRQRPLGPGFHSALSKTQD